ncbi:MAG: hypothetical protein VYC34_11315, partial [Planctomycetota bacterium]|nr:hypothetical protein [Planctomycetota bacterium]
QDEAALLIKSAADECEMRVLARPEDLHTGRLPGGRTVAVRPAGQERLPSAALGYAVGGGVETAAEDPDGVTAAEQFFEVRIEPEEGAQLLPGQRVVVRFDLPDKPYGIQWFERLRQLLQRRFRI